MVDPLVWPANSKTVLALSTLVMVSVSLVELDVRVSDRCCMLDTMPGQNSRTV